MDISENLKSKLFFKYFEEISKIPRGSGDEKVISDYLVAFARARNLEVIQDKALNIIIKKPATPGYENVPTVIIQGHMDMICEKNKGTKHDFKKDPLQLRTIGNMLYATDTTLGADDGVGVAYGLALLDADDISHPALEILLTTEEESTMNGAVNLETSHLDGKILINLDSDVEGTLLVSSAGGVGTKQRLNIVWKDAQKGLACFLIDIGGLSGGHSGEEINKGKGNSNKILGRILNDLSKEFEYFISKINGGVKSNAIPREGEAIILTDSKNIPILENKIEDFNKILKNELRIADPKVFVKLKKTEYTVDKVFSKETMDKAIVSLVLMQNGIQSMSMDIDGLVESSINLGVVTTLENEMVFESEIRSSIGSLREQILEQAKLVANILNCELIAHSAYLEWPYNPNSKIRRLFEKVYKEKYDVELNVMAVHAGLECGIFLEKMPYLDIVSYGPNAYEIHTPDEHLSISSVENTWEYLLDVLKEMNSFY